MPCFSHLARKGRDVRSSVFLDLGSYLTHNAVCFHYTFQSHLTCCFVQFRTKSKRVKNHIKSKLARYGTKIQSIGDALFHTDGRTIDDEVSNRYMLGESA